MHPDDRVGSVRTGDAAAAALIVLVLLAAHFTFFRYKRDFFFPDSITYLQPARSLELGRGFQTEPGVWETMRTPGYPAVLAALEKAGLGIAPICFAQHVASVAIAVALFFFVLRQTGNRFAASAAALVAGIDPPTIHHANKILSETTATAALLIFFVVWWNALRRPTTTRFAIAGMVLGLNVLVRPIALYFFIPAAIVSAVLLRRAPRAKLVAIFTAASLLIPYAWATRNYVRVGVFTVSSIAGVNLLLHRAAGVLAVEDRSPDEFRDRLADWQDTLQDDVAEKIDDDFDGAKPGELPHAVVGEYYGRTAIPIILGHLGALPHLLARGMFIDIFGTDFWAFADVSTLEPETVHLIFQIMTIAMAMSAAIGFVDLSRRNFPLALLVAVTVFYFVFMAAGGESEARFRVPVMPEYAIAIGAGVEATREKLRSALRSGRTPPR